MAVDHVKASPVTALDTVPYLADTSGEGAQGFVRVNEGSAVAVAASSVGATYQLVRLPSNAKVKKVFFESAAQTVGSFNLGAYYATDGLRGHPTALLVADAIDADFFASGIDCTSAVAITDVTNESGTNTIDKRSLPLWDALGLTADPKCNIDIVATVSTAVTTGTGRLGITVEWVV